MLDNITLKNGNGHWGISVLKKSELFMGGIKCLFGAGSSHQQSIRLLQIDTKVSKKVGLPESFGHHSALLKSI